MPINDTEQRTFTVTVTLTLSNQDEDGPTPTAANAQALVSEAMEKINRAGFENFSIEAFSTDDAQELSQEID